MNKQVWFVLMLSILSYTITAQSIITEKEKEVKTSGKYLWGYGTDQEEIKAKEMAVTLLFESEDFKTQLKSNPNLNKNAVSYIVRSRGNQLMAIAYIDKNETAVNREKETDIKKLKVGSKGKEISTVNLTEMDNSLDCKKPITVVNTKMASASKIINSLLEITNSVDLINALYDLKNQGKIMYSVKASAFDKVSDCYVLLFDKNSSKVTHILDKGNETRVNLLTSQKINLKEIPLMNGLQKIYIYEF